MSVVVENISKSFGPVRALRDIDLTVESGTLAVLLGPSGCGKSTLLRTIGGFETPDRGRILLDGTDVTHLPLGKRDLGFVFQNYALFPHQTVAQNVGFALSVRKRPAAEIADRVAELLDLVQLPGYERRRPHELSGGQRQRVALARALAANPKTLLLDEPFGALDTNVRKDLRRSLRALHERTHVTTLLVTHDPGEALEIADRVVVMRDGVVQQQDEPSRVYAEPANVFVMGFFGDVNALADGAGTYYVRPGDFSIDGRPFGNARAARVERVLDVGPRTQLELVFDDGQRISADIDRAVRERTQARPGVTLYVEPARFSAFERALA